MNLQYTIKKKGCGDIKKFMHGEKNDKKQRNSTIIAVTVRPSKCR